MSLEKGWFKEGENKEELQNVINDAIEERRIVHLLTEDKLEASLAVDDQEFNNAAQAIFSGKNVDELNPEEVVKVLEKMKEQKQEGETSGYLSKN